MTKVVLNSALSTYDVGIINANFAKIQAELQNKVLYRDNPTGEPNTLETDVNANGQRIYNLPEPTTSGEPLRLEDLENVAGNLQDALDAATDAAESAAAAAVSASESSSSASNAASSAAAAASSKTDAENAASSAAGSADTATQQAVVSTAYANVAGGYAASASSSAFDADTSAFDADTSAFDADTSANGANASAIAAANSASAAATSATNAAASAASAAGAVSGHISDPTDAHAASAITNTPDGGISATTVQAAINELDTEKAPLASPTFTGQASFPAGSAAAPSVKVGADQHGLYSVSSTTMGVAVQGFLKFQFTGAASSVNYLSASAQGAGTSPIFQSGGSDSNISLRLRTKGTGVFLVETGSSGNEQFRVNHVASAVNRVQVAGSATGTPVTVSVGGSDANCGLTFTAAGTGSLILGNATNGTVAALGTFASAEKAIYILNTTTAPTANPATGGYLYCEGGALKYRGSSGTITTIAAA